LILTQPNLKDLFYDANDDSFSSNDFTPRSKKRTYIFIDESQDGAIDGEIDDSAKAS
jgi:hypothetical protein